MDGWIDDEWLAGWMMNGWMDDDEWMGGWMMIGWWMDGWIYDEEWMDEEVWMDG